MGNALAPLVHRLISEEGGLPLGPFEVLEYDEATLIVCSTDVPVLSQVLSASPLQFQKALRLHGARQLMLAPAQDAKTAGHTVGYRSASQFSRDYTRFFGQGPARNVSGLRDRMGAAGS